MRFAEFVPFDRIQHSASTYSSFIGWIFVQQLFAHQNVAIFLVKIGVYIWQMTASMKKIGFSEIHHYKRRFPWTERKSIWFMELLKPFVRDNKEQGQFFIVLRSNGGKTMTFRGNDDCTPCTNCANQINFAFIISSNNSLSNLNFESKFEAINYFNRIRNIWALKPKNRGIYCALIDIAKLDIGDNLFLSWIFRWMTNGGFCFVSSHFIVRHGYHFHFRIEKIYSANCVPSWNLIALFLTIDY